MSINRVVLTGNLTRDPELRRTQSGMAILSFGIAVNDRRKNPQTGEWEDYANFIDCTQWERDGQKRSKIEVIVDDLEFLTPRGQNGSGGYQGGGSYQGGNGYQGGNSGGYQGGNAGGYQGGNSYQPAPAPTVDTTSSVYDDDIPF